ncbi:MAG: TIGR03943 family protein [Thermoflexales bacterium]|nr:TIGR03943 family protein [Thermoflexales bacterium]
MSSRAHSVAKAVVLAASGVMLYTHLRNGTLAFYINQRFAWLSLLAVLLFLTLALAMLGALLARRGAWEDERELVLTLSSAQPPRSEGRLSVWAVLVLLLPALLGLLISPRPLGAGAVEVRGIGLVAPDRPSASVGRAISEPSTILDWLREFARAGDPAALAGRKVEVVGFVYRDPRNAPGEFWVSRFTVSCCVADAAAVGLLARWAQADQLKPDEWVRVVGRFGVGEFAGERLPVILAERIEPVPPPSQPYLHP